MARTNRRPAQTAVPQPQPARLQSFSASYSGPLPPAGQLAQYETILPGSADRAFTMAEQQQVHRQSLEKTAVHGEAIRAYIGLAAGLIVALAFLAAAYSLIARGHDVAGSILGSVDLVSLVGVFIYGSRQRQNERRERMQQLTGGPRR